MARMVVIYKRPDDVAAFERHYFEKHIPLAKKLPGILKYEVSYGPIVSPRGPSDAYLIGTLSFADMAAMSAAFASEVGQACAADVREYAPDPSRYQMYLFEDKEV
jgi:uncharacterized protein (TIGR02118 family)